MLWAGFVQCHRNVLSSCLLGQDDYAITVCCILAVVRTSIQIESVRHGNGRHRWYLSVVDYEYVNFLTWMTQIFLFTNIGLLKCSICLLILRIKNEKTLRYCLYAMMAGLVVTNLEPIIVLLAQCRPIEKSWKTIPHGKCWPTQVRIYSIYVQVGTSYSSQRCLQSVTDLVASIFGYYRLHLRTSPDRRAVEGQNHHQDQDWCLLPDVIGPHCDSCCDNPGFVSRDQDS
jgi:hypothetical protein